MLSHLNSKAHHVPHILPLVGLASQERFVRVNNNLVQYVSWRNCAKAISAHEMETGKFFDVVLRVRDNSLVYKPFKLLDLLQHLSPQKPMRLPSSEADFQHIRSLPVLVKGCSGWGGHNDKVPLECCLLWVCFTSAPRAPSNCALLCRIPWGLGSVPPLLPLATLDARQGTQPACSWCQQVMLIPRQWMDPSLSRIADDFCITDKAWGSKNSETFLKEILASYGVPVHEEHDPGRFPIADGRCEDGSQFCLVEYAKDCWGEGSGYQQCKLNYLKPKPIKYMKKQSAGEHNSDKR